MTSVVLFFTVVSALAWSGFDLSRKALATRLPATEAVILLMLVQIPIFVLLSFWESQIILNTRYWLPAFASIAMNVIANILFLESLRRAPVSLALPMLSFTPVFSALSSWLLIHESLQAGQIIGIALIVGSTFYLQSEANEAPSGRDQKIRTGLLLMIVVALLWSLTPITDKICLRFTSPSWHAALQSVGIVFLLLFYRLRNASFGIGILSLWQQGTTNRRLIFIAGTCACAALFFQLQAIREYEVALFEALKRSVGLLCAIAGGFFFFQEAITTRKIIGALGLGLGIAFVLLASSHN